MKKHLSAENNQLVLNLKSGAEVNVAEDLFEFITDSLITYWNKWVQEGLLNIVQTDEGHYDIAPPDERKER